MIRTKRFLLVCFFSIICGSLYADDNVPQVSMPINTWQEKIDSLILLKFQVGELHDSLCMKDSIISNYIKQFEEINTALEKKNEEIATLKETNFSIKLELDKQKQLFSDNQKKISHADTITIQMIITYMGMKCSEKRINILKQNFDEISDAKLKDKYKEWKNVLSLYSITYNTIKEVAKTAVEKISKEDFAPLRERYVGECKAKINELEYVKRYQNNKSYSSSYLNEMLSLLNKALNPTNGVYDFSSVLGK